MSPALTPLSYHDVIDACAQPGCPFCRLADEAVDKFLAALLYEDVTDPAVRDRLRASLGFCNEHAWRLTQLEGGTALGIAIIYRDLVNTTANALAAARYERSGSLLRRAGERLDRARPAEATQAAVRALEPAEGCPACAQRDRMEQLALVAALDALDQADARLQAALQSSAGLCRVHLARVLALARSEAAFTFLRDLAVQQFAALRAELDEYIRKNDYRFAGEAFGPEGDSWRRAVAMIVGARGLR